MRDNSFADNSSTYDAVSRRTFLAATVGSAAAALVLGAMSRRLMAAEPAAMGSSPPPDVDPFMLDWTMQSSEVAKEKGETLSTPEADVKGWYKISLPSTVMAGLVANEEYPDVFVGDNLKKVPAARFKASWWYRKEFASGPLNGQQVWLYFKGINYRANVWLNGKLIADAKTAVGAYRDLELNVSSAIGSGANVLAVEVFPPGKGDLSITFVDWAPKVPDANMGLWQDVELRLSGAVTLRNPHVTSEFDVSTRTPEVAKITLMVDVANATDSAVTGTLETIIEGSQILQEVTLGAHEKKTVVLTPETHPQLTFRNPRLWWPYQLGKPEMYVVGMHFNVGGIQTDRVATTFGVRKVTSRLLPGTKEDKKESLLFTVNGVDLLVMGGGYAPDLFQRRAPKERPSYQEDHIRYVRDMNLNTVRLEGKLEDDAFYSLCDKYGVMVMPGWCCCSPWEQWKSWKEEDTNVAMASMSYQVRRARAHPSMLCFLNGSDHHPTAEIEAKYLAIEKELAWPNPTISSATAAKAASGPSGVKMEGPYKWEPPIYWLADKTKGGAHGFNTEVGPGACPPPLESLVAMLPEKNRWPIDAVWGFHCGGGTFAEMKDFTDALDKRFGPSKSIADFSWKAQAQAYETIRAMYEGFRRNKFNSGGVATGEIQWMLNNAWPSMIWHLYDYYFRPGGAYFATKLGCEPLHILYSYDNQTIVVANDTLEDRNDLMYSVEIYDIGSKKVFGYVGKISAPANKSTVAYTLPDKLTEKMISPTYFVRLTLMSGKNLRDEAPLSVNSYFLSTKPDVMNFAAENKDDWAYTPPKSYADYTQLETLMPVELSLKRSLVKADGTESVAVAEVANNSATIAMMVRLKLSKGKEGEEILPIRWEDNYFMLLPQESRTITGRYLTADAQGKEPAFSVECFNNNRA